MSLAPANYDFGKSSNYSFATTVTCANEDARKMFVEGFGHMLNFNHEQAIACYMKVAELDPNCAMAYWGSLIVSHQTTTGRLAWDQATIPFNRLSLSKGLFRIRTGSDRCIGSASLRRGT